MSPKNILSSLFFACYWSHPLASPWVAAILGSKAPTDLQNILSCKVRTGGVLNRSYIVQYVRCECWYCNDNENENFRYTVQPWKKSSNPNIMQEFYTKINPNKSILHVQRIEFLWKDLWYFMVAGEFWVFQILWGRCAYLSCNSGTCISLWAPSSGGQRLAPIQTQLPAKKQHTKT